MIFQTYYLKFYNSIAIFIAFLFTFQQTFQDIFDPLTVSEVKETTLSLLHLKKELNAQSRIDVPPMEIKAFKLKLK